MYSALISDCAERAVSDACDGAATDAAGSAADTVTVSLMLATLSWTETLVAVPSFTWMAVRRIGSKPGTNTSTTYDPLGTPGAEKCPRPSVVVATVAPVVSLRMTTAALTTALLSGSRTVPSTPAAAAACACSAGAEAGTRKARNRSRRASRFIVDLRR